jgi:hypothetical protein
VAEVDGPHAALTVVDRLDLDRYHLFHAIRADLLRRLGRHQEAVLAYEAAISRCENAAERAFLQRRREALAPGRRAAGDGAGRRAAGGGRRAVLSRETWFTDLSGDMVNTSPQHAGGWRCRGWECQPWTREWRF